jgi:hypothetical protein
MKHITVSTQKGVVTELEVTGKGIFQRYVLRYHENPLATGNWDMSISGNQPATWSGFRYRNNEVSVLLVADRDSTTET